MSTSTTLFSSILVASTSTHAQVAGWYVAPPDQLIAAGRLVSKLHSSWPWYAARASGLIAAILLLLLIVSGVGLLTGLTYRLLEPLAAWRAHRSLGIAFGVLVLVHIFTLLFDKFIGFNMLDLLVPFHSKYQPVVVGGAHIGSFYLALGIIALYFVVAVTITSLVWINKKPKPWRLVHYFSYTVLGLVFVHGLFMGTDLKHGILRLLWLAGGVVIVAALVQRARRSFTISEKD